MILALAGAAALAAAPAPAAAEGTLVPRKVIALYSRENIRKEFKDVSYLQLHQHGEMALNHLGLELEYVEASGPLPDPASLDGYRGVVTWFEQPESFSDPRPVCRWLSSVMRSGLKVVMLGYPGVYSRNPKGPPALSPECSEMLRALGAEVHGAYTFDPLSAHVALSDAKIMGFERKIDLFDAPTVPLVRLLPGATAYLTIALSEGPLRRTSPVALTPRGALALAPFFLYSNSEVEPAQNRWIVNPFLFFEEAFRLQGLPRPDVTTLNGRRVYFSHLDGDGFFNRSELDRRKWSGEIFLTEILERYPTSPFSVSMITGYEDLAAFNDDESKTIIKRILNRTNVEPASHGYAHPMIWHKGTLALDIPGYQMDARKEILGSIDFINKNMLPGRGATNLFFWTGDCLPSMSDIALAEGAGVLALNGGGGRFDSRFPSYSYLYPLSRLLGASRQIYAMSFNEENYTNLGLGPHYGFRELIETLERTGRPLRVRPVDVYIHYYSAERYAALESLRKIYDWAFSQPLIPVFASRYVDSARDFFSMRVVKLGEGRFRLEGGPSMRTVRFDRETRTPDLTASRGVIGFKRELGSLYIFLDESDLREVALSKRPAKGPYLSEANFEVFVWKRAAGGVRFKKRGWWKSQLVLGGLAPGRSYHVRGAGLDALLKTDGAGMLKVDFPDSEHSRPARDVSVEPAS